MTVSLVTALLTLCNAALRSRNEEEEFSFICQGTCLDNGRLLVDNTNHTHTYSQMPLLALFYVLPRNDFYYTHTDAHTFSFVLTIDQLSINIVGRVFRWVLVWYSVHNGHPQCSHSAFLEVRKRLLIKLQFVSFLPSSSPLSLPLSGWREIRWPLHTRG